MTTLWFGVELAYCFACSEPDGADHGEASRAASA
jgi:hypothetical protein